MSDDEFMMNDAVDDEDYDFDYSGEEDDDDADTGPENSYYNAKAKKSSEPDDAIVEFEAIVDSEEKKGEWGFKALKQLTKVTFRLGRYKASLGYYKRLLGYIKSSVTRNTAEKAINGILDYVSAEKDLDTALMQEWYKATNEALADAKIERMSMKTNLKLAKLWLDRKEYGQLSHILKELKIACAPTAAELQSDGGADNTKATLLLEVMALEILMFTETKNNKKLKEVYEQSRRVKEGISHPRIQGVIRECGGKMHMNEKEWSKAQVAFFDAFKAYDEAGSPQRIQVLKYLVLAVMLMESEINPFDSQETKPYKNDPEIMAMTNLVSAYQRRDVHEAEKILRDNKATIMDDPFIQTFITDVLRSLRTQWILEIIRPYTRIEISYLAKQLKIEKEEVEDILVSAILDGRVKGKIDQTTERLELERNKALETRRYHALDHWTSQVQALQSTMLSKAANSLAPQSGGGGGGGMMMGGHGGGMFLDAEDYGMRW